MVTHGAGMLNILGENGSRDSHVLFYDSFVSYDKDALLEELERSTLQDSDEYSSSTSLPLDQPSRKEDNQAETSTTPAAEDSTRPLLVNFSFFIDS